MILDGKLQAARVKASIRERVDANTSAGKSVPKMVVVQVGLDPASTVYVNQKEKACAEVGMDFEKVALPADISHDDMLAKLAELNNDPKIHGFIVQQPMPPHLDPDEILAFVAPHKDVDCLHPNNVGLVTEGRGILLPCTPAGVIRLLEAYDIPLKGKKAVVVGRSRIVGKPMGLMLLEKDATVTICHRYTENLAEYTKQADILAVAVGIPKLITADMVKPGCTIIDIGINRLEKKDEKGRKLCGDVDFDACVEKAEYITPVPGGVGPMTVAVLMENTLKAWEMAQ
ncbi:MAG: bifunctional methylenetetrahydrofolate dehydrogenase/methenyltetrahydrofolate cyclohydrolase FolD [Turicibacter sp.]|nr:bifunctional methylenetetrahydrofolate dehydrogenase/methenyltetrahydrofolate cyclohydrolase FolD [Turicibacter sp.]